MSQPLPSEIILPSGRRGYLNPYRGTYTESRDYGLRMQRNFARGIGQAEARGHGSPTGLSEWAIRQQRFRQKYGFSESTWRRWRRNYINEINETRASTYVPGQNGNPITLSDIAQDIEANSLRAQMVPGIFVPPESYTEERLVRLLDVVRAYREGDPTPGRADFYARESYRPIELWWYH